MRSIQNENDILEGNVVTENNHLMRFHIQKNFILRGNITGIHGRDRDAHQSTSKD